VRFSDLLIQADKHFIYYTVGAIQESPAAPMPAAEKTTGPASNHHVIASP
jgi:hypothetical protein